MKELKVARFIFRVVLLMLAFDAADARTSLSWGSMMFLLVVGVYAAAFDSWRPSR